LKLEGYRDRTTPDPGGSISFMSGPSILLIVADAPLRADDNDPMVH